MDDALVLMLFLASLSVNTLHIFPPGTSDLWNGLARGRSTGTPVSELVA